MPDENPRELRPLGELKDDVHAELDESIGQLRAGDLEPEEWDHNTQGIRALTSTLSLLTNLEAREAPAPGAAVDEVLGIVYEVIAALPGLEAAGDVADQVDARVRGKLAEAGR